MNGGHVDRDGEDSRGLNVNSSWTIAEPTSAPPGMAPSLIGVVMIRAGK
jgi:hypothetical protein